VRYALMSYVCAEYFMSRQNTSAQCVQIILRALTGRSGLPLSFIHTIRSLYTTQFNIISLSRLVYVTCSRLCRVWLQ
jgi:hypothetical protein